MKMYHWAVALAVVAILFAVMAALKEIIQGSSGFRRVSTTTNGGKKFWSSAWDRATNLFPSNWQVRAAAIAGYGLFVLVVAYGYPEEWAKWKSAGALFWLAHIVVVILVFLPIWDKGNNFARLMVGIVVVLILLGTHSRVTGGKPLFSLNSSAASATTSIVTSVGEEEPTGKRRFMVIAPTEGWSEVIKIPEGYEFDTKPMSGVGQKFFIMANESPDAIYKGKDLIPGKTELIRLRSGEEEAVKVYVVLKPL